MSSSKVTGTASIYEDIRNKILSFEIQPNSRFTETELANYYSVSRTPVRQALQRLEAEELIIIRPKQGCFVRAIDLDELNDYYQIRINLEMLGLESACTNMSDRALRELHDVWDYDELNASEVSFDEIAQLDEAFHLTLVEGGGNKPLAKILRDINNRLRIVRRLDFTDMERIKKTCEEHQRILNFLLQRDLSSAKAEMMNHITKSEEFSKMLTTIQLGIHKHKNFSFGAS